MIGIEKLHRAALTFFAARASFAARALFAAAIVLGSLGCAGRVINLSVLPEDVIAVRLWENEEARQRKDLMAQLVGKPGNLPRIGVMDLGDLANRSRTGDNRDPSNRFPGRLALINPRTFEVTFPEGAPFGARPLSWSSDRERLIFSSNRQNGRFQIPLPLDSSIARGNR